MQGSSGGGWSGKCVPVGLDNWCGQHTHQPPAVRSQRLKQGNIVCLHDDTLDGRWKKKKKESVRHAHSNKLHTHSHCIRFPCVIFARKQLKLSLIVQHARQPPSTAPPRWRRKRCLASPLPSSGRWTRCPQKNLRSLGKLKSEKHGKGVTSPHHSSPVLHRRSSILSGLSRLFLYGWLSSDFCGKLVDLGHIASGIYHRNRDVQPEKLLLLHLSSSADVCHTQVEDKVKH